MSNWQTESLEEKISEILSQVPEYTEGHHFGRPFLTAYQLAIAIARNYPDTFAALALPIGGLGAGQQNSLAQYIARQLSGEIKAGRLKHIEGSFISNEDLQDITFIHSGQPIRSSLTSSGYPLSMFRIHPAEGGRGTRAQDASPLDG